MYHFILFAKKQAEVVESELKNEIIIFQTLGLSSGLNVVYKCEVNWISNI